MEALELIRILVVEDDAIAGQDIKEVLEAQGYEVSDLVSTGVEAVRAVRELAVDLVLMDIRVPGSMDGVEAARRIREEADVPVVYVTAHSDDDTVRRATETGPFGYVVKPVERTELKTAIEVALQRHRMERLLRESREQYRELFEEDVVAHHVTTPEGKFLAVNRAMAELVGAGSKDEVLDLAAEEVFVDPADRRALVDEVRRGGRVSGRRGFVLRFDGEEVPVLRSVRGTFDSAGRLKEIHSTLVDMSRERRLEETLRRSARMEAVARLAGGIAHDFNNLLTGIRGSVELVLSDESLSEEGIDDLTVVLDACDRARALVQSLFATGGRNGSPRASLDLRTVVDGITDVLRRLMGGGANLVVDAGAEPAWVEGNPSQLEQVVLNLVLNARDATSEDGTVRVLLEKVDELEGGSTEQFAGSTAYAGRSDAIEPSESSGPTRWNRLTVSDTGTGMDRSTVEQAFDPFFSTKDDGTGLGLAVVYGIVREHGGEIVVESEPGRGTTFHVYLPRVAPSHPRPPSG